MSGTPTPRVLCVDDEPNVLEGIARTLRRRFDVRTAGDANAALRLVESEGPFAVILSDLRMPGGDGVTLFSWIREIAPDSVRILLTGQADLPSAMSAVNEGSVFRFLSKPCAPEVLIGALDEGVELYRRITAERDVLQQTLGGSVKMLTDILAISHPAAFARGARAKSLISELAAGIRGGVGWDVEVAAMLSQIGVALLPPATAEKVYAGQPLDPDEQGAVDRLPHTAAELVSNIPRMREVGEILLYQNLRFDGTSAVTGAPWGKRIPLGSRLLKVVLDFDVLETRGVLGAEAIAQLRALPGWYDPELLELLAAARGSGTAARRVVEVDVSSLRTGMVLAEDIKNAAGLLWMARGQEITPRVLERVWEMRGQLQKRVRVFEPPKRKPEAEAA